MAKLNFVDDEQAPRRILNPLQLIATLVVSGGLIGGIVFLIHRSVVIFTPPLSGTAGTTILYGATGLLLLPLLWGLYRLWNARHFGWLRKYGLPLAIWIITFISAFGNSDLNLMQRSDVMSCVQINDGGGVRYECSGCYEPYPFSGFSQCDSSSRRIEWRFVYRKIGGLPIAYVTEREREEISPTFAPPPFISTGNPPPGGVPPFLLTPANATISPVTPQPGAPVPPFLMTPSLLPTQRTPQPTVSKFNAARTATAIGSTPTPIPRILPTTMGQP